MNKDVIKKLLIAAAVTSSMVLTGVAWAEDADNDGVNDAIDLCPNTTIPEQVPERHLGYLRFALTNGDTTFNKFSGESSFILEDTGGCSCEQIIELSGEDQWSLQSNYGCSIDTMRTFAGAVTASANNLLTGDADNDGVNDAIDLCPNTTIPEQVPERYLGYLRFALTNDDTTFNKFSGESSFILEDTGGCSCEQVIELSGEDQWSLQSNYGCSINTMHTFAGAVTAAANKLSRFTDMGDGTVRDNDSGLIWLKEATCGEMPGTSSIGEARTLAIAEAAVAALADGMCGLTDGSMAEDWRLPTKQEWEAFVSPEYYEPALANTKGDAQWSEGDAFTGLLDSFGYAYYFYSSTLDLTDHPNDPNADFFVFLAFLDDGVLSSTRDDQTLGASVWPVRIDN